MFILPNVDTEALLPAPGPVTTIEAGELKLMAELELAIKLALFAKPTVPADTLIALPLLIVCAALAPKLTELPVKLIVCATGALNDLELFRFNAPDEFSVMPLLLEFIAEVPNVLMIAAVPLVCKLKAPLAVRLPLLVRFSVAALPLLVI